MKLIDNIIQVPYTLITFSAAQLSTMLKVTLIEKYGIFDFKSFSRESSEDNVKDRFPEIYEYQNFFIMRRNDESFLLLDGFRRLLLYKDLPTFDITVRVYEESDLPQEKLLKLMLMLNHTKFVGGNGRYYDKGFNQLLYIMYGFKPNEMEKLFEGYITQEEETVEGSYYSSYGENADKLVNSHERLVHPKAIEDLQFLYALSKARPVTNGLKFLGTVIYNTRLRNPEIKFDLNQFLSLTDNAVVKKLEGSGPSTHGAREVATLKKLMEMYVNAIKTMCGEEIEETFAEAIERFKSLKADLKKKNKNLILLGSRNSWQQKDAIVKYLLDNKKSPKIYTLVKPMLDYDPLLKTGLYEEFYINSLRISSHLMSTNYYYSFEFNGEKYHVDSGFNGGYKVSDQSSHSKTMKKNEVEFFIDLNEMTDFDVEINDKRRN